MRTQKYRRPLEWWKIIGAFLIIASALMFLRSGAEMFESWETSGSLNTCFSQANESLSAEGKELCQQQAYYAGVFTRLDQRGLTNKQYWVLLAKPIADLFIWIIGFIIGLALYTKRHGCCMPNPEMMHAHMKGKGKRFRFKSHRKR